MIVIVMHHIIMMFNDHCFITIRMIVMNRYTARPHHCDDPRQS